MTKVACICIDAKNKPKIIPDSLWVKKGKEYHITHIYQQVNQVGIKGCLIAEHDISCYYPYNCYRLDRFAFTQEEFEKLLKMMEECTELDRISIDEIMEELEIIHVENLVF